MLQGLTVNTNYLADVKKCENDNGKLSPEVYGLAYLMLITKVNRLFNTEDVWQLAYRSQLMFPEINFAENLLLNDEMAQFSRENERYCLTVNDFIALVGIEISDSRYNFLAQQKFEEAFTANYRVAVFLGTLLDIKFELNVFKEKSKRIKIKQRSLSGIDELTKTKAKVFADQLVKSIPLTAFERIKLECAQKLKQLEQRQLKKAECVFKWSDFTDSQKDEVADIIWNDYDERDENSELYDAMHLCWAIIRGYATFSMNPENDYVAEEYDEFLNYERYEVPDDTGGISFYAYFTCLGLNRVLEKMLLWMKIDSAPFAFYLNAN